MKEKKGGEKKKTKEVKRKEENKWKIVFWNVAVLAKKDKKFRDTVKKWKVKVLIKVWMDEKGWKLWMERLLRGYSQRYTTCREKM